MSLTVEELNQALIDKIDDLQSPPTGKDYVNDTLARARWFAQNWGKM